MIVSYRHEFVFIKPHKVAGSSVERALSTVCGPHDVITGGRSSTFPGVKGPQNHRRPLRTLTPRQGAKAILRRRWPTIPYHASVAEVRRLIPAHRWQEFFTFAIERNPWDKAVSRYYWDSSLQDPDAARARSFSEYLRICPEWKLSNWKIYTLDGEIAVDRVLRYERLADEFADLWRERIGGAPPQMPREKTGSRPETTRSWRALYNSDDAERVATVCKNEIEAFGYTFE